MSKSKSIKSEAEKYNKVSQREHILIRPDSYIGDVDPVSEELWIYSDKDKIMTKKKITYTPGLFKIYDEVLVNSRDASVNDPSCDTIKVEYNIDEGYISVYNNGDVGIPVEIHPEHKTLVPTMIFGELLTSSNYDDNEERTTGGKNGYGAKLANIYSTKFIVEVDDAKRRKRFIQTWKNNMEVTEEAKISKLPDKTRSSVKVTFYPDFKRFQIENLNNDHYNLFYRRAIDLAGTSDKMKIYFNNEKINIANFKNYIELYYKDSEIYYDDSNDRWTVGVLYKPDAGGEVVSFVNGISTYRGGTHCNHVTDNIVKVLIEDYIKKKDKNIKISPTIVKENLLFFINSVIINPAFSSQTKDTLKTPVSKFGSKYEPNQTFLKKLAKCGIVEQVIEFAKFKENSSLKKLDGKKQVKIAGIPKLEDANKAGTKESSKCTLILTEGDSAKATAMAGLGVIGRDYYGVFPLKGKPLNVREASTAQLLKNEEIKNIITILGLKLGEDYTSDEKFNTLRYGHVMSLADQDSVTGDTPLLLKNENNMLEIRTIDDISDNWQNYNEKEMSDTKFKIWTDKGWTDIKKVIRHKVNKKIYRVLTYTGVVDVTEDHSLIKDNLEEIAPKDCKIGDSLLHSFPDTFDSNDFGITHDDAYNMGQNWDCNNIAIELINSPKEIKEQFINGYLENNNFNYDNFNINSKIGAHGLYLLCKSIDYEVSIDNNLDNHTVYTLTATKDYSNNNAIKKIINMGTTEQYVYDLETENHHFQAGVGRLIVHNTDGFHIKGLIINIFHTLWPSLIIRDGFIRSLNTPIVKAFKGKDLESSKDVKEFYNLIDYEKFKENSETKNWNIKYYKGLGTSTSQEAREYFRDIDDKVITYLWKTKEKDIKAKFSDSKEESSDDESVVSDNSSVSSEHSEHTELTGVISVFVEKKDDDDAIRLAFEKSRADERKKWLMNYDKNRVITYETRTIPYYEFIHSELIHFSNDDLQRSIPSVIDGLKPSQRKILYGAFLRGLDKDQVKVSQLAGFVSDKAAYHHGEMSLNGAIVGMAQNFVGSNNINILKPNGQFGTRLLGGKDAASPRYIWTKLDDLSTIIFNTNDEPILNQQNEDGIPIEPETYAPIIPMVLVNGTEGIGTGFSTEVLPYNPLKIIRNLKNIIRGKEFEPMDPWWQGFEGTMKKITDYSYEVYGNYTKKGNKLIITELPVGEWTTKYKEHLEKLLNPQIKEDDKKKKMAKKKEVKKKENPFLGYKDNNTDTRVNFELTFEDGYLDTVDDKELERTYHLVKKFSITNMHLYSPEGSIKKYRNVEDIMVDYHRSRLEFYVKRKAHQLAILEYQLKMISFKVKFILMVVEKKLDINNKKKADIEAKLDELKFPKLGRNKDDTSLTYDYLLGMPIYNLTEEKINELKKQEEDKQTEHDELDKKSVKKIWIEELDLLETKYTKWYEVQMSKMHESGGKKSGKKSDKKSDKKK